MKPPLVTGLAIALVASAVVAAAAPAGGKGSGYFSFKTGKLELKNAYAVRIEKNEAPGQFETYVYLTSRPIDPVKTADAFSPDSDVSSQLQGQPGGFVRICINPDGTECGLWYSREEPSDSFNTAGMGEFKLTTNTDKRIEGRWHIDEPEKFFDSTFQYDLVFATDVTPPTPGTDLGATGGEPGKAYLAYIKAIKDGDFAALRKMSGEMGAWQYPEDDLNRCKENLKWLREGRPATAKILKAEQRGDVAILVVEGVDRDDIKKRGRVKMIKDAGGWREETSDLDTVD